LILNLFIKDNVKVAGTQTVKTQIMKFGFLKIFKVKNVYWEDNGNI